MNMCVFSIELSSLKPIQLNDITDKLKDLVVNQKLKNGLLHVASLHTTASIRINEKCDALEADFVEFSENWISSKKAYAHNKVAIDGRPNAHSHLMSYFMPSSETLVVKDGELILGVWQRVFFIELDGPREKRSAQVTFLGEIDG